MNRNAGHWYSLATALLAGSGLVLFRVEGWHVSAFFLLVVSANQLGYLEARGRWKR